MLRKLCLSVLLLSTFTPEADSNGFKIIFKLEVKNIKSFDLDWSKHDKSDVFMLIVSNDAVIARTNIKKDVTDHAFAQEFELNYDGNSNQKLEILVYDDDTSGAGGAKKQKEDQHIGDAVFKLDDISKIGKHTYPIKAGNKEHGQLIVNTVALWAKDRNCECKAAR